MKDAKEALQKTEARWEAKGMPEEGIFARRLERAEERVNTAQEVVGTAQEVVKALAGDVVAERRAKRARPGPAVAPRPAFPDALRKTNGFAHVLDWRPAGGAVGRFTERLVNLELRDVAVPGGEALKVADLGAWPLFGDGGAAAGQTLVLRGEARRGYEAVWGFRQKLDAPPDAGSGEWEGAYRVVTGPRGSGKSRGMTYLLSLALSSGERRPVVYEARGIGRAFAWLPTADAGGYDVFVADIQVGLPLEHLAVLEDRNVVYLIDTEAEGSEGVESKWSYNVSCRGTVCVAASPRPGRLASFGKQSSRLSFCFNPWTTEELVAARESMGWRVDEEELRARIAEAGPFPRYIGSGETFERRRASVRKAVLEVPGRGVTALFTKRWDPDPGDRVAALLVGSAAMMARRMMDGDEADESSPFERCCFAARHFCLVPASVMAGTLLGARFPELRGVLRVAGEAVLGRLDDEDFSAGLAQNAVVLELLPHVEALVRCEWGAVPAASAEEREAVTSVMRRSGRCKAVREAVPPGSEARVSLVRAQLVYVLADAAHSSAEYGKALTLFEEELRIAKAALGDEHPDVAATLNSMAIVYSAQGEHGEALPLHEQALRIRTAALGAEHPDVATSLNNLAVLYDDQGEYGKALPLYEEALRIKKAALGEEHPSVATTLNNLARLYCDHDEDEKALPLHAQALRIRKAALGDEHPSVASTLHDLAVLYDNQGEYGKAMPLYEESLRIRKAALGDEHPDVALSQRDLNECKAAQARK